MGEVNRLKHDDSPKRDPAKMVEDALNADPDEVPNLKKKIKDYDCRIIKLWAERDILKSELDKAKIIIEREVGEGKTFEDILWEENGWKGRSEKIQILKTKLKKAKETFGDGVSTVSFTTENTMVSGTKSNAEWNLERIDGNRARENDALKEEILVLWDQLKQLDDKCKGALARKKTVEKDMKSLKDDF